MAKARETKKATPAVETPKEVKKQAAPVATAGASWFTKGDAGFDRKHAQDEFARMRKEKGAPRFYLKATPGNHPEGEGKDNEARLVFLDSAGFWVHEHNLKLEQKWGNFFTCTKDFKPCDICTQLNDKSIYTCYFTVIDTRKFTRKDGTISKNRKVMFPAKGAAIDIIESLKKKHGDLRGMVIDVKRTSDRDPNCGRDFDVVLKDGRVARIDPLKKFPEGDLSVPYDYMTVLAPPTPKELEVAQVSVTRVVGSEEDIDEVTSVAAVADEDDVSGLLGD